MLPADHAADDPRSCQLWLRRELVGLGINDRAIRRQVRDGELTRVRHGAYVSTTDWNRLDRAGRFVVHGRAVQRQAQASCVLSHTSAIAEYGAPLWGVDVGRVHVSRTDGLSCGTASDVRQHGTRLPPETVVLIHRRLVTAPARAVLESLTCVSPEVGLCLANYMLNAGFTTSHELQHEYVGIENWRESRRAEIVLRLADPRPESVGESRVMWACYLGGLPRPVPQYEVRDPSGRIVARVDFAWPELGVFLEFDGRIKYEKLLRTGERASDVVIRERDRERLICRLTGWTCVRVVWADLDNLAKFLWMLGDAFRLARTA